MKKTILTKHKIKTQGAPLVNNVFVEHRAYKVALLTIDMKSKYCEVSGFSSGEKEYPEIEFDINERSLKLHKTKNYETILSLREFKGWKIFSASVGGKYSMNVVLTKNI